MVFVGAKREFAEYNPYDGAYWDYVKDKLKMILRAKGKTATEVFGGKSADKYRKELQKVVALSDNPDTIKALQRYEYDKAVQYIDIIPDSALEKTIINILSDERKGEEV